ncbi:MAG: AbrB/MazE/SpoVT family DNA-binding domain-containing protein [Bryobacteraceae bacterium]
MVTTRLSTKGQIVLPKHVRTSRAWGPGIEFTVEETGDGILLRPERALAARAFSYPGGWFPAAVRRQRHFK